MIHFIKLNTEAKVSIGMPIRDDMFFCDCKQDGSKKTKTKTKITYKNNPELEFLVIETVSEILKEIDEVYANIIYEQKKELNPKKWVS